jgi:hypothetical protein
MGNPSYFLRSKGSAKILLKNLNESLKEEIESSTFLKKGNDYITLEEFGILNNGKIIFF